MSYPPDLTRSLVETILRHPGDYEWSIQGLGMLRTYLPGDWRLHVWSTAAVTRNVSRLHDHPWSFTSFLIAGRLKNTRYRLVPRGQPRRSFGAEWQRVRIKCGPDGGTVSTPEIVWLESEPAEHYDAKAHGIYSQQADEIHDTVPQDGTVTVIKRVKSHDPDHANVYFPMGESWVTAGGATRTHGDTVRRICDNALKRWF